MEGGGDSQTGAAEETAGEAGEEIEAITLKIFDSNCEASGP